VNDNSKYSHRSLLLLLLAAIGSAFALRGLHVPGAWLFGPLAVSAVFAVRGWNAIHLPNPVYIGGQAVIGTALGAGFSLNTLAVIPEHAGVFTFAVVFILLTSLGNGWLLSRFTRLDPGTSYLGTMPGGASAMAAMSDSLGADTRLVAAIQYIRLLVILASLLVLAPLLKAHAPVAIHGATISFYATEFVAWKFATLLALATMGWLVGTYTRLPAGSFLIPTLLYFLLGLAGVNLGGWPWPILASAYIIMGLQIGGRFRPETVTMIRSVILPVVGTTLLLLVASVVLAFLVEHLMHIGLVAAYLAATPGGLDSVAAVATDLHIDTTVVVSMHLVRLLCVLTFGPWLARWCAGTPKKTGMGRAETVP
jgi:membrane AbrB-like protein